MRKVTYVIVGGGVAGVSAAEAIRERDREGSILMLSGEAQMPYTRPMLSKAPLLSMERKKLLLHEAEWYQEKKIELCLGIWATALDTAQHTITLSSGETVEYGKCILATGAKNFIPPFTGREDVSILDIRTIEDLRALRRTTALGSRAVVIGGGVIGLEIAAELHHYGLDVTVLEAMERLMPRLIDKSTSDYIQQRLSQIQIETGVGITRLYRQGEATVVEAADGRTWPCEALVVSCGVRADTALAQSAGIACERAIVVDETMATSAPDVYACGDCAQFTGMNYALWSQSQSQGRVAGDRAAGGDAAYAGCNTSLVMNLDGVAIFALGDLGQSGGEGYEVEETTWPAPKNLLVDQRRPAVPGRGLRVKKDGKLVGISLVGDLRKMQAWKTELLGERGKKK